MNDSKLITALCLSVLGLLIIFGTCLVYAETHISYEAQLAAYEAAVAAIAASFLVFFIAAVSEKYPLALFSLGTLLLLFFPFARAYTIGLSTDPYVSIPVRYCVGHRGILNVAGTNASYLTREHFYTICHDLTTESFYGASLQMRKSNVRALHLTIILNPTRDRPCGENSLSDHDAERKCELVMTYL